MVKEFLYNLKKSMYYILEDFKFKDFNQEEILGLPCKKEKYYSTVNCHSRELTLEKLDESRDYYNKYCRYLIAGLLEANKELKAKDSNHYINCRMHFYPLYEYDSLKRYSKEASEIRESREKFIFN